MTGSSLKSTPTNSSRGTYLANTTRQTVKGVAKMSPTGPQSQVQKAIIMSRGTGETPTLLPYSNGSSSILLIVFKPRNSPITTSGHHQSVKNPRLKIVGMAAAAQNPISGIKSSGTDRNPHRNA